MKSIKYLILSSSLLATSIFVQPTFAAENAAPVPAVTDQIMAKAKANVNWKTAYSTANHLQVVFMNISPTTNPKNEIGVEVHPFDQAILIAEGNGKAELNEKTFPIKAGDLIFIPQGTKHNVINLNPTKPLKVISFYSSNDIPANASYSKKSDEPQN